MLLAAAALTLAVAGPVPAGAQEGDVVEFGGEVAGSGNAQAVTVAPRAGRLALPVKLVTAGSRIEGEVTRASAAAMDLGLLGSLGALALTSTPTLDRLGLGFGDIARGFTFPPAAQADSRSTPVDERNPLLPPVEAGPLTFGGGNQRAEAIEAGEGRGRAEGGALELDLGAVRVVGSGLVAESMSSPTAAESVAALGELRFEAFGTVSLLRGLEWRARQEMGKEPEASFRLGSADIGGRAYDTGSLDQVAAAFEALNESLAPSGLRLEPPVASREKGAAVAPLRLAFDDSPAAAMFVGPVYERALADAVNELEAAVVGGVPETGLAVTVLNVVLAAATGRGGASVGLGGVDATIGRRPIERYTYAPVLGNQAPYEPPPSTSSYALPPPPARPPPEAEPAPGAGPLAPPPLAVAEPAVAAEDVPAFLLIGAGALALTALAATDRRRIAGVLSGLTQAAPR